MKRLILVICVIVFFIFLIPNSDEQIRIRVIANSDSEVDQNVKLEVLKYLYENYNLEFNSIVDCDEYLKREFLNINNDLKLIFDNIEVTYENHIFYNKTYNNMVSKDEEYKTLLIKIGKSEGENFWGVLYSDNFIENEDTIKYNSYLLELFKGKGN